MNAEATNSWMTSALPLGSRGGRFALQFKDPTSQILAKYNELMFRGAILASAQKGASQRIDQGLSVNQELSAIETAREPIFHVDLRWFAGAAIFELVTVLLVLIQFYGWWKFQKSISLSPLDLALAFDSPLLSDINSAVGATGVVKHAGGMKIRFGHVQASGESEGWKAGGQSPGRLGVGHSENVVRPRKGERFSR